MYHANAHPHKNAYGNQAFRTHIFGSTFKPQPVSKELQICELQSQELLRYILAVTTQPFPEEHGAVESLGALSSTDSGRAHSNKRHLLKIITFNLIIT